VSKKKSLRRSAKKEGLTGNARGGGIQRAKNQPRKKKKDKVLTCSAERKKGKRPLMAICMHRRKGLEELNRPAGLEKKRTGGKIIKKSDPREEPN